MTEKPIRCPKCKTAKIWLREWINCFTDWEPGENEGYHGAGEYFKVEGHCKRCEHVWTLKGEIQMNDKLKERLKLSLTHE